MLCFVERTAKMSYTSLSWRVERASPVGRVNLSWLVALASVCVAPTILRLAQRAAFAGSASQQWLVSHVLLVAERLSATLW